MDSLRPIRSDDDPAEAPEPDSAGVGEVRQVDPDPPVAILWLFDPEQRHFLREHPVYRAGPPARPLGFRPPLAR
jgi:hypothetical protein